MSQKKVQPVQLETSTLDANSVGGLDAAAINSALATKSNTSHTHGTLYYTKGEIDTSLSLKSDTTHIHDTFDRASSVLSGANIFSNIVVTDGIVTAIATRALTPANIGAQAAGTYNTIIGTDTDISYSSATVLSTLVMTDGVITGHTSRTLTPANIGAAPLASPALTGNPTAPTQTAGNNSTRLATTAFVQTAAGAGNVVAMVSFNGTIATPTIYASSNVSSVVRNATGIYTINFTTALPNTNYLVTGTAQRTTASRALAMAPNSGGAYSTTQLQVATIHDAGGPENSPRCSIVIFNV